MELFKGRGVLREEHFFSKKVIWHLDEREMGVIQ